MGLILKIDDIRNFKNKKKISMITCYDYTFAKIIDKSLIDIILVGDSGVTIQFGFSDTTHANIEIMSIMTKAVRTGSFNKFIVSDMPFLSYRKGKNFALDCAKKLLLAGANAIKIEGVLGHENIIYHLIESGIPIMGHIGLTPQHINITGYKVQGKNYNSALLIKKQALELERLGCFSIVVECVPVKLGCEIQELTNIPIIGIGSGRIMDGQVLVLQDILGLNNLKKTKFIREYINGFKIILDSINTFYQSILCEKYPNLSESYCY